MVVHVLVLWYPWHAGLLEISPAGTNRYLCGAALLDTWHLATAAHCVKSYFPRELWVRLGDWDVNTKAEPYPHLDLPVQDIFIHERFFPATLHNDLAMVRLSQAVPWAQLPQVKCVVPGCTFLYTAQQVRPVCRPHTATGPVTAARWAPSLFLLHWEF